MLSLVWNLVEDKFGNDLKSALSAFKCLRYFDLQNLMNCSQVLVIFKYFPPSDLKKELSTYLAAANGMQSSWNGGRITQFSYHFGLLVDWPFFYFNLLLKAAEWVFSLLSNSFKENQQNALEDYVSTSVMLQNKHCSHC